MMTLSLKMLKLVYWMIDRDRGSPVFAEKSLMVDSSSRSSADARSADVFRTETLAENDPSSSLNSNLDSTAGVPLNSLPPTQSPSE